MIAAPTLHTTIAELIGGWPSARTVLARRGMACVGCSMASFETISEAAEAYGFDPLQFIGEVIAARSRHIPRPAQIGGTRARERHPSPAGSKS
jgi:hybrid cluster-associated redox disulfide protein